MPIEKVPDGFKFELESHQYVLIKRKGDSTRYKMLIDGGYDLVAGVVSSNSVYRLLFKLISDMKPMAGNKLYIHFGDLAEHFGVSTTACYNIFKKLREAGLVRKLKKGHYLIDPRIVWSGRTVDRAKAIVDWLEGA